MHAIRRILVAVKDPSAGSLPAVAKAIQLAAACDAELELFHAIDSSGHADARRMSAGHPLELEGDERTQFRQRLGRIAARARLHTPTVTASAERDYPVYEAIIREALRSRADLIVAERHAGRHIAPGLLGLADWELLRLSPLPVLLVKRSRPYKRPRVLAAVDPTHAFAKPAGLDGEIIDLARRFSEVLHGQLHAVHAYDPLRASMLAKDGTAAVRAREAAAAQAKADLARTVRSAHIPPARRHLCGRHPIDAVLEVATTLHSDIVVMGAVSRSGLRRLFIGNTAEQLLDRLPCDLLVVKPRGWETRAPRARPAVRHITLQPPH